ncbi:mannose-6-phosphate isomerase, class I [Vibrio sp. CAU 1672]|uniref:mannose-6-phosphate isomerase, class I n=1 Tax=Vibrio sp. CAU 1672 TaxID=3032594 RepID=UPI0023DA6A15|nr:mannose-6-phosphate isomerase, class I [Vibrio sp. CAU 1672]MDF2155706.1 mannose-6-phosphate isomerase, class I [Vibrio sp. CAU 1672]
MIYLLNNPIKNFAWGSRDAISRYFNIANPSNDHQAEVWMGAHPSASSTITVNGTDYSLCEAISASPEYWLGKKAEQKDVSLPFLMKILAAEEPLSIQVHPSKGAAEQGYAEENKQGIPLDAAHRNYKDANHKPELVYAITPYLAMNGFRTFDQIIANFDTVNVASIKQLFAPFKQVPNSATLAGFFSSLLALEGDAKKQAIQELLTSVESVDDNTSVTEALSLIRRIQKLYPEDIGLFSPLFLNIIELQPGEAMFLYAETPHAYINGLGIEVMANSDNVLRAGLTPKHIDVEELVSNTSFQPIEFEQLVLEPLSKDSHHVYLTPVDDFNFDVLNPQGELSISMSSAEVLLCLSDSVTISTRTDSKVLQKGESAILPAITEQYTVSGQGSLARAY